jgi:hypothetical protein
MVRAVEYPRLLSSVFYTGVTAFPLKWLLIYPYKTEWTPFQTKILRKSGSSGNRTQDLWVCSLEL